MTATAASAIASRPRTAMTFLLATCFLVGAGTGAVAMRVYAFRAAHHAIVLSERKEMTLERWKKELNLTDDQTAQLRLVLDDFDKYYDSVLADGHQRILAVLTPEQRDIFEKKLRNRSQSFH